MQKILLLGGPIQKIPVYRIILSKNNIDSFKLLVIMKIVDSFWSKGASRLCYDIGIKFTYW